ncbi:MAG: S9 family peptidase [Anaerolineales bacterium]|nr:S9 family peptidase [Anaerolineales bacterium]
MYRIESLLSARLFLVPQIVGNRIFFISNLSGHMSLYAMDYGGSVPEPLLPPQIALQNPTLMHESMSYKVFPKLGKVLVMIDDNGNEAYQPMLVPMHGGYPEPVFADTFAQHQVNLIHAEADTNTVWFWASSRVEPINRGYRANLETGEIVKLDESMYGGFPIGSNADYTKVITGDGYGAGDIVIFMKENGSDERKPIYGVPLSERTPGQQIPPNSIGECHFVDNDRALLFFNSIFSDTYGVALLPLDTREPKPVTITGQVHTGAGVLELFQHQHGDHYLVTYNIDGCTWLYEATFHLDTLTLHLDRVLVGQGQLANGVLKGFNYNKTTDRYVLSFTTATTPPQIYTLEGPNRDQIKQHTRERVLGLPDGILSEGEDASFTSFDGLRVSARLYLPHASLGFQGKRPVVVYVHGGPQGQEHPDFSWFSMPLIQQLTLHGFAVFVPNVRGSTGYGFDYTNRVVKDWGGQDRLDHVHAMTEVLPKDARLDTSRAAVVGRSYGGYMTLTLAGRHPELWSAACDMFGPYDLTTFAQRVPATWKPLIALLIGNPETEPEFMAERSPKTYIHQMTCPLLVIQGKNDPRVVEPESAMLVEELRGMGKEVDYLMFEDEGHDVLKFENRVRCYNAIVELFEKYLKP